MINYKKYFLRQLSIKESQFKQSEVDRNAFPGIDPEELEVGKEEEEEEHGFPPKQAQKIAIDHLKEPDQHHYYKGVEKAKGMGMLKDINVMGMSPTAIPTPIIGFTVRGSSTGGLPSGLDQRRSNITPTNLGGYEKIPIETLNSKLVDKTPTNSQINSSAPISTVKSDTNDVEQHPQVRFISLLAKEGIVVGQKGKFYPDNYLRLYDLIKMTVDLYRHKVGYVLTGDEGLLQE